MPGEFEFRQNEEDYQLLNHSLVAESSWMDKRKKNKSKNKEEEGLSETQIKNMEQSKRMILVKQI